jgi:hypothetical protein
MTPCGAVHLSVVQTPGAATTETVKYAGDVGCRHLEQRVRGFAPIGSRSVAEQPPIQE